MTSKYFSKSALKGLSRIGDILCPANADFPSFTQLGCIEHVDKMIGYAPASDIKDLGMVLGILSIMPEGVLKWLVRTMGESHNKGGGLQNIFRQLDFGLRGIIFGLYYSGKTGKGFSGKKPLDVIGFELNRIVD